MELNRDSFEPEFVDDGDFDETFPYQTTRAYDLIGDLNEVAGGFSSGKLDPDEMPSMVLAAEDFLQRDGYVLDWWLRDNLETAIKECNDARAAVLTARDIADQTFDNIELRYLRHDARRLVEREMASRQKRRFGPRCGDHLDQRPRRVCISY